WLIMAAMGRAILADFPVADKREEARVPWMRGLMAGGMGIAHGPHQHHRRCRLQARGPPRNREPQHSQHAKGTRPMKTKTRVRAGRFTTNHHETLGRDTRRKRSSRPIGSVPHPEVSGESR